MKLLSDNLSYQFLKRLYNDPTQLKMNGNTYAGKSKLDVLMPAEFWNDITGKVVIDFGCGEGREAIEIAKRGADRVVGIDNRQRVLEAASALAEDVGLQDRCVFTSNNDVRADVVVSIDSFEHFSDPREILLIMSRLLKPGGNVWISFGPTWYHPLGGHLFSVFPWAHIVFSEQSLIRWRSDFKNDGATSFGTVAGGLNKMTISQFERLVAESPFAIEWLKLVPIRAARHFWTPLTREFFTSVVQCKLTVPRLTI